MRVGVPECVFRGGCLSAIHSMAVASAALGLCKSYSRSSHENIKTLKPLFRTPGNVSVQKGLAGLKGFIRVL